MAGNIKGITIEFRGDTTSLDKALRNVKKETKDIDNELKAVNKNLKFDPKNVELLRQKAGLLQQKIKLTEESLQSMKKAQADMDARGVDKASAEYQELRRNIIEAESKLKTFNGQLKETEASASKLGRLGSALQAVGGKMEAAGKALAPLSGAAAAGLGALTSLGLKAASSADDLMTLSKQTGIAVEDLQLYAAAADLVDVSVETLAKSQQTLKRNMLTASEGGGAAEYFNQLGIAVTDAEGNLRDSDTVFQEAIKALGEMENETERDAVAMKLFGKSASELNPLIEDAGATYSEVAGMLSEHGLAPLSEEELQRANDFQDSLDKIKLIFNQLVQIVGGKIASALGPLMEKVVDKVAALAEWIGQIPEETLTKVLGALAAIAALAPGLMILGKVITGIGTAISVVSKVMTLATGPIGLIIAAIAALIAIIVLVVKHWDEIKAKAIEVWEKIKEVYNGVADWFREKFQAAWEAIKNVFSKVGDFFSDLWEAIKSKFTTLAVAVGDAISGAVKSGINGVISLIENTINGAIRLINGAINLINKIPGVNIGTLGELSLPRLAKGGVLYGAQTVIAGEAGPEAIIPLDKLFAQMDKMAQTINGGNTVINVYPSSSMDVNALAREIERRIIAAQNSRRLAWQ